MTIRYVRPSRLQVGFILILTTASFLSESRAASLWDDPDLQWAKHYLEQKDWSSALDSYNEYYSRKGNIHSIHHFNMAMCYFVDGNIGEAIISIQSIRPDELTTKNRSKLDRLTTNILNEVRVDKKYWSLKKSGKKITLKTIRSHYSGGGTMEAAPPRLSRKRYAIREGKFFALFEHDK